jgi:hypothetical protein
MEQGLEKPTTTNMCKIRAIRPIASSMEGILLEFLELEKEALTEDLTKDRLTEAEITFQKLEMLIEVKLGTQGRLMAATTPIELREEAPSLIGLSLDHQSQKKDTIWIREDILSRIELQLTKVQEGQEALTITKEVLRLSKKLIEMKFQKLG